MSAKISGVLLVSAIYGVLALAACGGDDPSTATPTPGRVAGSSTLVNTAPQVGARAELTRAAILQLSGSVQDDTAPGGQLTIQWTQVSGPGAVEFADPARVDTTATFTVAGTYVLRLTATDGEFTASDDVTVVVEP